MTLRRPRCGWCEEPPSCAMRSLHALGARHAWKRRWAGSGGGGRERVTRRVPGLGRCQWIRTTIAWTRHATFITVWRGWGEGGGGGGEGIRGGALKPEGEGA